MVSGDAWSQQAGVRCSPTLSRPGGDSGAPRGDGKSSLLPGSSIALPSVSASPPGAFWKAVHVQVDGIPSARVWASPSVTSDFSHIRCDLDVYRQIRPENVNARKTTASRLLLRQFTEPAGPAGLGCGGAVKKRSVPPGQEHLPRCPLCRSRAGLGRCVPRPCPSVSPVSRSSQFPLCPLHPLGFLNWHRTSGPVFPKPHSYFPPPGRPGGAHVSFPAVFLCCEGGA